MGDLKNAVDTFFDAYSERVNRSLQGEPVDIEGTTNAFEKCFVESSPAGVVCGENDEKFRESIPKGYEFYKNIGTQSMNIISKDITVLDPMHLLVKVHWTAEYKKKDDSRIDIGFDVFYFIRHRDNILKIFAYVTGDEQEVLKAHGLV